MVGRWISFWDGPISGAVLVSRRVKEISLDGQFVWFLLSQRLPSWELSHILSQRYFWVDDFPFPKGYVSSLKSSLTKLLGDSIFVGFYDQDFSCQTWQRRWPAKKLQSCYYRWVGVSKSPFCTTNLGEYVWNFFQASDMQIQVKHPQKGPTSQNCEVDEVFLVWPDVCSKVLTRFSVRFSIPKISRWWITVGQTK